MQHPWRHDFQRLLNNLTRPSYRQYGAHLRQVHAFILRTPAMSGVISALQARTTSFDIEEWYHRELAPQRRGYAEWPDDDEHKVRACWFLIESCVVSDRSGDTNDAGAVADLFAVERHSNLNDSAYRFTQLVVSPLVEYIEARINSSSDVLYMLERYRRRVEWFDAHELFARYEADTQRGERLYDESLRRFLLDEGIDYPFSQPRSSSGEADVIADLHSDDPLVCEIKLYDGASYGVPYLRKGLRQAVRYAHDYGKHVAHLVVFNLSEERLELPTDDPKAGRPPRVVVEGVTVFICVVQARPLPSASSDKRARVRRVDRGDLVAESAEGVDAAPAT